MDETDNLLLKIRNLQTYFYTDDGVAKAVDGVDLELVEGGTLGVVGESGCGKSVTALSIMRLIPDPPGKIIQGKILFNRKDLLALSEAEMRKIRGRSISMIFQEPMTSLNPVFQIGDQISEVLTLHEGLSKKEAWNRSIEMLKMVGIPAAERRVTEYPHQLSGGMRQRAMIAMALACSPKLMIADEPTTALDVTIQAQILELINRLQREKGMSVILITHNLGVIAETAQMVAVMYAGRVVEYTDVRTLFATPQHPYTQGLLKSIPRLDQDHAKKAKLEAIPGLVPSLLDLPPGCKFSNRCKYVFEKCNQEPPLEEVSSGHFVRCWLHIHP
ncbi:MAG: peptide transporter ATP-binding protein [Deltaproteobacteria bacterium]|jgi:peptide/nickel transport system ATP-binding protein/oligopeptide transport system ATP-binding protein|nr:peptide transporter ATP-binding protein [Deltaproteobacteria bacterium]MBP1717759.1 peptide transporter ATP-binding protein [Deltaproteobacteria bacterium]